MVYELLKCVFKSSKPHIFKFRATPLFSNTSVHLIRICYVLDFVLGAVDAKTIKAWSCPYRTGGEDRRVNKVQ